MILGKYHSPLGEMTLAVEADNLAGLWFDDQKYFGSVIKAGATFGEHPLLNRTREWLDVYFSGRQPDFILPLAEARTDIARKVRNAMLAIPPGQTISYSTLAAEVGMPRAVRAVASAVAKNPFIIIVPCHRVIGKNGKLTGYAAGLDRKKALLQLESHSS